MLLASTRRPANRRAASRLSSTADTQVVVGNVILHVEDVLAQANHGRLVTDRVHPVKRRIDRRGIPDVALNKLRARIEVIRTPDIGSRQQGVQNPDLVAGRYELVDDVRSDEPGSAGDEDHASRPYVTDARAPRRVRTLFRIL